VGQLNILVGGGSGEGGRSVWDDTHPDEMGGWFCELEKDRKHKRRNRWLSTGGEGGTTLFVERVTVVRILEPTGKNTEKKRKKETKDNDSEGGTIARSSQWEHVRNYRAKKNKTKNAQKRGGD